MSKLCEDKRGIAARLATAHAACSSASLLLLFSKVRTKPGMLPSLAMVILQ